MGITPYGASKVSHVCKQLGVFAGRGWKKGVWVLAREGSVCMGCGSEVGGAQGKRFGAEFK